MTTGPDSCGAQLSSRTPDPCPTAEATELNRCSSAPRGAADARCGVEASGNAVSKPTPTGSGDPNGRRGVWPTRARRWTGAVGGWRHAPPRAGSTSRCGLDHSDGPGSTAADSDDGVEENDDVSVSSASASTARSAVRAAAWSDPIDADPSVGVTSGMATDAAAFVDPLDVSGVVAANWVSARPSGAEVAAAGAAGAASGDGDTIGPEVLRWIGGWAGETERKGISRSGAPIPPGRVRHDVDAGGDAAGLVTDEAAASDCSTGVGCTDTDPGKAIGEVPALASVSMVARSADPEGEFEVDASDLVAVAPAGEAASRAPSSGAVSSDGAASTAGPASGRPTPVTGKSISVDGRDSVRSSTTGWSTGGADTSADGVGSAHGGSDTVPAFRWIVGRRAAGGWRSGMSAPGAYGCGRARSAVPTGPSADTRCSSGARKVGECHVCRPASKPAESSTSGCSAVARWIGGNPGQYAGGDVVTGAGAAVRRQGSHMGLTDLCRRAAG